MKLLLAALYKQPIPPAAGSLTLQMVNLRIKHCKLADLRIFSLLCFFLRESSYWSAQRCPIMVDTHREKRRWVPPESMWSGIMDGGKHRLTPNPRRLCLNLMCGLKTPNSPLLLTVLAKPSTFALISIIRCAFDKITVLYKRSTKSKELCVC